MASAPDKRAAEATIAAAHVEARAENQFRDSRAQFHKARSAPEPTSQPPVRLEARQSVVVVTTTPRPRPRLTDLRRLGHERKAAAMSYEQGAPN
jgi:hypothetical protein